MLEFNNEYVQKIYTSVHWEVLNPDARNWSVRQKIYSAEILQTYITKLMDNFDLSEYTDESDYVSYLNETNDKVIVMGYSFSPGNLLKDVDYTAFREGFNNWVDTLDKENDVNYQALEQDLETINQFIEELQEQLDDN
jgi:hypothetical protein